MRPYLAIDWGTSNVRAWRVDTDGAPQAEAEWPLGVGRLQRGQAAEVFASAICDALGAKGWPSLMCGMIGSTLGWRETPYLPCPAGAAEAAAAVETVQKDGPVRIVPGLCAAGLSGAADVMRGEETQIFGLEALGDEDAVLACLPGTHSKWARLEAGRIVRFLTAMTGELYDVLTQHSILRGEPTLIDWDAFQEGLGAAGTGDALSIRLFSARTRQVAGGAPPSSTSAYLSGLLIGAEFASMLSHLEVKQGARLIIIGAPSLTEPYQRAAHYFGLHADVRDGAAAALAGLNRLVTQGALDGP